MTIEDIYCKDMREENVPECKHCDEFFSTISQTSYKFCPFCGKELDI